MTGDRSRETPSHLAQTFPGPQVAHVRGEMFGIADIGPVDGPFLPRLRCDSAGPLRGCRRLVVHPVIEITVVFDSSSL